MASAVPGAQADDLALHFNALPIQAALAWQLLAPPGVAQDSGAAEVCSSPHPGPQCYRLRLSLPLLRQLDRPGVLSLQDASGQARYAVLRGLGDGTVTLQWPGTTQRVTLRSLARFWRGEVAGLWQPPPGYRTGLAEGETNPALARFTTLLAQFEGRPLPAQAAAATLLDAQLRTRIRAFQRSQGIEPDGLPGPMTWILLEQALGLAHPRLNAGDAPT